MKIVVLAGGYSPEREVSLSSGSLIANALMQNGHRVLLLDVYLGIPTLPKDPETLFRSEGKYEHKITQTVPDLEALKQESGNGNALIGKHVIDLCRIADVAFLALHGGMGENGQLQATLECFGIPYTGSCSLGSALAMDKDIAKRLFRFANVPTPDWVCFDAERDDLDSLIATVGLPCVVKPTGCGSSVGVSIVQTRAELTKALEKASAYGDRVVVEKKITGRELTMGILDGKPLPPVEIIPQSGWYDYENKYQGTTREECPARISPELCAEMERITLRAFEALRLRGYARFDYLLDENDRLWCLEGNTLPGMTPTSLLPQEAQAIGVSYRELCETLLQLAK